MQRNDLLGYPSIASVLQVTTVYAKGPYKLRVTSDNQNVEFTGLRFEITDGAEFSLSLAAEEFVSTATFTGVTNQARNGNLSCPGGRVEVAICTRIVRGVCYSLMEPDWNRQMKWCLREPTKLLMDSPPLLTAGIQRWSVQR